MADRVGHVRRRLGLALTVIVPTLVAIVGGGPAPTAAASASAAAYVPVEPVRLADTRRPACGCIRLDAATIAVDAGGRLDIPGRLTAVAVTITATPTATEGFVTVYPGGTARPTISTLNTRRDRVVANSTIVPVGADGSIEIFRLVPGDVIVDVTGAFVAAGSSRAGRFVSVAPRRLADTRTAAAPHGRLGRSADLTIALPSGVAADATALVVNVTSVGELGPSYLAVRPAGSRRRETSFLNTNGSGQAVAGSVIVPVSADGFTIHSLAGGHLIVDLVGWFTGPSAAASSTGLYVAAGPERLLDTRRTRPRIWPGGTIELPSPVPGAAALVTNVTVTDADRAGFVTAYPAGTPRPLTSTINPAFFNHTLANLAVSRVSERGVAYFGLAGVDLVVDVTGWFTGTPVAATRPPAPNRPGRSRVLLVGDSTLAGLTLVPASSEALIGFDPVIDAGPCRRLLRPSCLSDTTGLIPTTAVEAIVGTPGELDVVAIKTGYNDWFSDFPREFDAVVWAARSKGAHTVLWFSYNEESRSANARRAYRENNEDLYHLVTLAGYADVVLADWRRYTLERPHWFTDGSHTTTAGAWAITDYVARWIAALEHRPCPRAWTPGGAIPDPCPPPDGVGPVADPMALY